MSLPIFSDGNLFIRFVPSCTADSCCLMKRQTFFWTFFVPQEFWINKIFIASERLKLSLLNACSVGPAFQVKSWHEIQKGKKHEILGKNLILIVLTIMMITHTVWPDLVKFRHFGKNFDSLFLTWLNAEPTLANLLHCWANFQCCKWQNIEK